MPEYQSWRQVAGYFDGDGTIATSDLSNQPYKLGLSLVFVDQSLDQIANIRNFLQKHGIKTSNILKTSKGTAHMVAVSRFGSVKKTLRLMLPFLCKKAIEAKGALDYYEGRLTGNGLIAIFQQEVEAGRRERRERKVPIDVPYLYGAGDKVMKGRRRQRLRDAFGKYRAKVTLEDFQSIRKKYYEDGKVMKELTAEYPQYCRSTIQRILGRSKRGVLVKNVGMIRPPRKA